MICDKLDTINPKLQGVLFFDETGNLCLMKRDHSVTIFSGTTLEAIHDKEPSLQMNQVLTYSDQHHTTGMDIFLDAESVGIVTMNEKTKIHEPSKVPIVRESSTTAKSL